MGPQSIWTDFFFYPSKLLPCEKFQHNFKYEDQSLVSGQNKTAQKLSTYQSKSLIRTLFEVQEGKHWLRWAASQFKLSQQEAYRAAKRQHKHTQDAVRTQTVWSAPKSDKPHCHWTKDLVFLQINTDKRKYI